MLPGSGRTLPKTRVRGFRPGGPPSRPGFRPLSARNSYWGRGWATAGRCKGEHFYLRARYYDPTTAQFLTRDPKVNTTRQPYSYAMDTPLDGSDPSGLKSLLDIVNDYNPFNGLVQGAQNAWNATFGHVNVGACVIYCRSQDITGGTGSGAHVGLGVDVGAGIDLGPPVGFGGDLPSDPEWCAGIKLVNGCLDDQNHFGCQFSLGIGLGFYRQWTPKRPDDLW